MITAHQMSHENHNQAYKYRTLEVQSVHTYYIVKTINFKNKCACSVTLSSGQSYLKCSPRLLTQNWGQFVLSKVFLEAINNINEVFSLPIPWFTMIFDLSEHWARKKNTVEFRIFLTPGKSN